MPNYLGWDDDAQYPILMLEDLSLAHWPPPWSEGQVQAVLETLQVVASQRLSGLPRLEQEASLTRGWHEVATNPESFLTLGVATEKWLDKTLPTLLAIPAAEILKGESLLHQDVRSDNLCFLGSRTVIIDWNSACLGNSVFDIVVWLPSLEMEGGPKPETIVSNAGQYAAILSGYFASRAGLPAPPGAPNVRKIQLTQLRSALPWTVRELDLPPLDGR